MIFWVFFQIGLLSIGGGYAVIPMISQEVVTRRGWLSLQEFTDVITISQMTPGPLAVNTSTFVGLQLHGILGAICATLGCVLPGTLLALGLYLFFQRHRDHVIVSDLLWGLRGASVGLIGSAAYTILALALCDQESLSVMNVSLPSALLAVGCLLLLRRLPPILVLLLCALIGFIASLI